MIFALCLVYNQAGGSKQRIKARVSDTTGTSRPIEASRGYLQVASPPTRRRYRPPPGRVYTAGEPIFIFTPSQTPPSSLFSRTDERSATGAYPAGTPDVPGLSRYHSDAEEPKGEILVDL